jgi:hypothetical protein
MIEITEGHVTARREGDNLFLKCNACGYEETGLTCASSATSTQPKISHFSAWVITVFFLICCGCSRLMRVVRL